VEELEGVLHSMAADMAGTDDVLQRVRDMDPAARQAFLAQLDEGGLAKSAKIGSRSI
jgi:hypothetical protein